MSPTAPAKRNSSTAATTSRWIPPGEWWLVSSFWLLIALASWLEMWLFRSTDPYEALRYTGVQWLPWVVLTPPIFSLTSAFPLERGHWLRNLGVQLAAGFVVVAVLSGLAYLHGPPPFSRPGGDHGPGPSHEVGEPGPPRDGGHGPGRMGPEQAPGRAEAGHQLAGGNPNDRPHRPHASPPSRLMFFFFLASFQLPTYWAVLGIAHALTFYKRAKERERRSAELEAHLTQARLEALRMQLNPHFLFNTLNSISSLVYDEPRAADEMIGALSELLRLSLNSSDRQEVTLREELHFLDRYLHIEQARFGDRLRIEKDLDPAVLDALVPILVLQPLVENAVKHGLESRLAPGVIAIAASRVGTSLRLQVADNGRGVPPGTTLREGVGLANTRSRLRELYGKNASFQFRIREGGGFLVEIVLPWHLVPVGGETVTAPVWEKAATVAKTAEIQPRPIT